MPSPALAPELNVLSDLDEAWATRHAGPRLRAVRTAGERLRDRLTASPRVVAVRTLPLTTFLYPTRDAFGGAARSLAPYVVVTHRCLLVQFLQRGELRHLLFNPTDVVAARQTPCCKHLVATVGQRLSGEPFTRPFDSLELQLTALGLSVDHIDYLAFPHFRAQDLRPLLGTVDGRLRPRFPRARLLAPADGWSAWDDLHPAERVWFQADGKLGVRTDQVVPTAGDHELGDGIWMIRTPGHAVGNQTLLVHTGSGLWGSSDNGTSADSYSPFDSGVPGLRSACRQRGVDLVLHANESACLADQYTSMVLERTLVDRVKHAPAFVQMFPSSEVTPSVLAPGIRPTMVHGALTSGTVARP